MPQITPDRRNGSFGFEPLISIEYKVSYRVQSSTLSRHHRREELILKFSITEIGRSPDALKARIARNRAELGLLQKEPDTSTQNT